MKDFHSDTNKKTKQQQQQQQYRWIKSRCL